MKEEKNNETKAKDSQIFDDSLKTLSDKTEEPPKIYKIGKRGLSIDRKDFLKSIATLGGLAALGNTLQSCEESYLDIQNDGKTCTCHAVCTCNTDWDNKMSDSGNSFSSIYDVNNTCTCDTVCTCNSVCSCDLVCSCDTEGGGTYYGGGYYTYWYPN